jgi:hypothetical protein
MIGISRSYREFPLAQAQQVVLAQDASDAPVADLPSAPAQLRHDPWTAVIGELKGDALDCIPQFHVAVLALAIRVVAIEAGAADLAEFAQALDRHRGPFFDLPLNLPVGCGFPVKACSIRSSSIRCKHPFKKSISRACWPTLRSNCATFVSSQRRFPSPGNAFPGPSRNSFRQRCSRFALTSNARATSATLAPASNRCNAAIFTSFENFLLVPATSRSPFADYRLLTVCLKKRCNSKLSLFALAPTQQDATNRLCNMVRTRLNNSSDSELKTLFIGIAERFLQGGVSLNEIGTRTLH